jgi:prepilin-type N-terminal cleavage/methylation domain-containing protein
VSTLTSSRSHRGFTLIELVTVMTLIGILAAIAIPNYLGVVDRARAASILGDVRAIQVAYSNFSADDGGRTRNAAWGTVPADLVPYLPDGFRFANDFADYRWIRLRPDASPFGVESAELRVRPLPDYRPSLLNILAGMTNRTRTVKTRTQVRFYMVP